MSTAKQTPPTQRPAAIGHWLTWGKSRGSRHRDVQGGTTRATVLGAGDGLLTNLSLVLGVAGASTNASAVRLAAVAGLLAGAFSMAAGELVSVRAQQRWSKGKCKSSRAWIPDMLPGLTDHDRVADPRRILVQWLVSTSCRGIVSNPVASPTAALTRCPPCVLTPRARLASSAHACRQPLFASATA